MVLIPDQGAVEELAAASADPALGYRIHTRGPHVQSTVRIPASARILAFDPPDRVVFSWDISPQWTIETDQAQASEVEVRFYAESPTRTRVELEHRHIDLHGPGWEAITGGVDGPEGCPLYLDRYAALVKEGS